MRILAQDFLTPLSNPAENLETFCRNPSETPAESFDLATAKIEEWCEDANRWVAVSGRGLLSQALGHYHPAAGQLGDRVAT